MALDFSELNGFVPGALGCGRDSSASAVGGRLLSSRKPL
jgi:hypothetical protein